MCLMVYLSSKKKRPTTVWNQENPKFFVETYNPSYTDETTQHNVMEEIKVKFSQPFIYYIGSSECCGCGFRQEWFEFDDEENRKEIAENHSHLFEFVSECLKDEDFVEIYACWAGNEKENAQTERKIMVTELIKSNFFFQENELITMQNAPL